MEQQHSEHPKLFFFRDFGDLATCYVDSMPATEAILVLASQLAT